MTPAMRIAPVTSAESPPCALIAATAATKDADVPRYEGTFPLTISSKMIVNGKVPSYLGTSASFVAAVAPIRAQGGDSAAVTRAILIEGVILPLVGFLVHY